MLCRDISLVGIELAFKGVYKSRILMVIGHFTGGEFGFSIGMIFYDL